MVEQEQGRRDFIKRSTMAVAASAAQLGIARSAHAAGSDILRIGVVGCGGRGSGAAIQALNADRNTKLVAMADAFEDRLETSYKNLSAATVPYSQVEQSDDLASRVDVSPEHRFVGFDAYKQVIDLVDVVILATPPHFRPHQLAYAVEKGVHVFAEKPVATDARGVRQCLESCELAKKKDLSIVSGLCWRYHNPRQETMQRVLDGAIGEPVSIETIYNTGGVWQPRKTRDQVESDMEYQLRNWYYYTWLSGDHIVEQAVHALDTMAWAMGDQAPIKCWGSGGRQVRVDPKYGDLFDHFSVIYEYPNDVRGYHSCRHWSGASTKVQDYILGSKGFCDVWKHKIRGDVSWRYRGDNNPMYQAEHDKLFASIRSATPINDGLYMCRSTLLAIMGRMAAYTGKEITWDMAVRSQQELGPKEYAWGEAPSVIVPTPGVTPFV